MREELCHSGWTVRARLVGLPGQKLRTNRGLTSLSASFNIVERMVIPLELTYGFSPKDFALNVLRSVPGGLTENSVGTLELPGHAGREEMARVEYRPA
jgi:hypothetical protein